MEGELFLPEVDRLISRTINQADSWHFDTIGIGRCRRSQGRFKKKQTKPASSASVGKFVFVQGDA